MNRRDFIKTAALISLAASSNVPRLAGAADNDIVLNIEPDREFPRNSEGAFVTLKSGRILFIYTRFKGGSADHSPADLVRIESADGGRTWSQEPKVVVKNEGSGNVMSVSLLRLRTGEIALFYAEKKSFIDCHAMMRLSTDEAETWSEPRPITDAPGYFVLNNDRVIQLATGRLIAPLAFHRSRHGDGKNPHSLDLRAIVLWYLSDDNGRSWQEAENWWALPEISRTGFQEPGVVELADGRLFSWTRTDQGAQYGCYSEDGGKHWPLPVKTTLMSPEAPASIKRLPNSSALLAIFNDHSGQFSFPKNKRTPLVAALSNDGGKTWSKRLLLESDPAGWYCYTAIHFSADSVLLAYSAGDAKAGYLSRLRIRRVRLDSLMNG